jgi:UDP-N-acetylmuramoylalanine--D-glutamate ligase
MSFGPVFSGQRYALREMGAEVFVWDDNETSRAAALDFVQARPSEVPGHLDALILSPGIPHILPAPHPEAAWAAGQKIPILTDAELLFQAVRRSGSKARFAGITGTNGKSTTTALLAHILTTAGIPNAAGANLGPAALALPLLPDSGVYVLEMSSYMLERIATLRFDVAAMLNLSPDHLDRHGDMAGYAAAKRHIFDRMDAGCTAVIGVDDAESRAMADELATPTRIVRISSDDIRNLKAKALPGAHNAQNAAAATALARALAVSDSAITEGIATFPGLPHRQAEIADIDGIRFINDSKATNADAASRAMSCYDKFIWIAGGMGKEGGIESLAPLFPRIAAAFLIGRDAPVFAETLAAHAVTHHIAETLDRAVPQALAAAKSTGTNIILFSPAAASFDQFPNFEARGDNFTTLAREQT